MTLSELITALREKSGRLDLLDATFTEFINQGSRLLDEMETSGKRTQRVFQLLDAGTGGAYVTLPPEKRWIDSVTCLTSDKRWELTKISPKEIRQLLHEGSPGVPMYYSLVTADLAGAPLSSDLDFALDYDVVTLGTGNNLTYLLIYPVADSVSAYQIEVEGVFYSPFLSAGIPVNRWSELYSYLLLQAAQYWMLKDVYDFATAETLRKDLQVGVRSITHDAWSDEDYESLGG